MIEEVFRNYLTNAIHYCYKEKEVRVWTEKYMYEKPGDTYEEGSILGNLRVYVYDQGPNVPEGELEKLFIKFYKVDKAKPENMAEAASVCPLSRLPCRHIRSVMVCIM